MLSKRDLRNAHIALAAGIVVLVVGAFLVRDGGEGPMQLAGLAGLVATFGTALFLNARDDRQGKHVKRRQ
jgi:hypothetical protein